MTGVGTKELDDADPAVLRTYMIREYRPGFPSILFGNIEGRRGWAARFMFVSLAVLGLVKVAIRSKVCRSTVYAITRLLNWIG